ncbi:DegV family protein [Peptostreptococcus porci]|uniref:DegV family protein n=1 Tax=Peptostreptococcus porci TaxID=2652282 RepID=UPI0023F14452|nr:DegV family protein [Peptostreptococcus porci]MDD7182305.1 DegV family protein [Peptostreptococcus porci]MDY4127580.1 DegV family protein [Peptostreptococcus porci]
MDIKLICDSLSDIPDEIQAKEYLEVVPLTLIMDGKEYKDGVDISKEEFYKVVMEMEDIPKTSQATYGQFIEIFEKNINQGKKILYIAGSSTKSGTYQSAVLAKKDIDGDVHIFDTEQLSLGAGQYVIRACDMIEEGLSIEEIVEKLDEIRDSVEILFAPASFDFLKKSGRVPMATALIGSMLNIKPIFKMKDGEINLEAKVRGIKKLVANLVDLVIEKNKDNLSQLTVTIGHGCNLDDFNKLKKEVEEKLNGKVKRLMVTKGGVCICSHTGPDIVAISFSK